MHFEGSWLRHTGAWGHWLARPAPDFRRCCARDSHRRAVRFRVDPVVRVLRQAVSELAVRAAVERLQEQDVQCTLQPPSTVSAAPVT